MSEDVAAKIHVDSYVSHQALRSSHGGGAKLRIRADDTGAAFRAFLHARTPFPNGATIKTATLYVYRHKSWGSALNLTIKRVNEAWKEGHVNWNNQPDVADLNAVTFHAPSGPDKDEFAIDVTEIFRDVSAGKDYHGLRITSDLDSTRSLYASESPAQEVNPWIYFEWTEAPYPPSDLRPSGGHVVGTAAPHLYWDFTDNIGSTKQGSSQVQVSASTDFTGALLYNSGKQANTSHDWMLAGTGIATLIDPGDTVYWRGRVWDQDDLVSGWSDTVSFKYVPKGTLTIDNPSPPPDNFTDDLTPNFIFDLADATLSRIKLKVWQIRPNGSLKLWYSFHERKVPGDFNSITLPGKYALKSLRSDGQQAVYRVGIWAWDTQDRVHGNAGPGGSDANYYAQRDFTYVRSGLPVPVDTLAATPAPGDSFGEADSARYGRPKVHLEWTRSTAPDYFCLKADGHEIFPRLDPADLLTDPETYEFDYWRAEPGVEVEYEVEAVEYGVGDHAKRSADNPTDTATTDVRGKWLVDEDDSLAVQFYSGGDSPQFEIGESGTTNFPVGGRVPLRTTDSVRGFEGSIGGTLHNASVKDDLLTLKGRVSQVFRYMQPGFNIPVALAELGQLNPVSQTGGNEVRWQAAINLYQVDEFFDVEGY